MPEVSMWMKDVRLLGKGRLENLVDVDIEHSLCMFTSKTSVVNHAMLVQSLD